MYRLIFLVGFWGGSMEGDVIFMNRNQYSRPMLQCSDKFIDLSKEPDLYIETFV